MNKSKLSANLNWSKMNCSLSSQPLILSIFVAVVVVLLLSTRVLSYRPISRALLPPGPPGQPILGHLRLIPSNNPEIYYQRLSHEHKSDILSFSVLGQPIIVLNSVQAAVDLLDKRGSNYCDRPDFTLFKVMGWKKTLTFLRWGPEFHTHRRLLQRIFQKSNIIQYRQLQIRETRVLLQELLRSPEAWESALRRFATAIVMNIGFGIKVHGDSNPFVQMAADASHALAHGGTPGGTPVDFFPVLRYLPRFLQDKTLRFATDWRWAIRNIHDKPYEAMLASEGEHPSLVQSLLAQRQRQLEKGERPELDVEDIKGAAAAVYAAGQDTVWSTLVVFILNVLLHPDAQERAQKALDDKVGRHRLPTFEDRNQLSYIDCIVQEVFRWCPVSPLGVPHRSLKADIYKGFLIPAGSFVYANARAMTHDQAIYHNPDHFDPNRYLSVEEGGRGEPSPNGHFGFGRRGCVGKHLAEASVWIVVACVLSTMKVQKKKDRNGEDMEPTVKFTNGLTSHPVQFPCSMVPRDEQAARLIQMMAV